MEHIGAKLDAIERNMRINSADPIALHGFTQVANFILRDARLSVGARTAYSLLLSYAWHNDLRFPGQGRLASDMGMGVTSVNRFIKELEEASLIEIARRGQGRSNFYTINFVVRKRTRNS
jgi:hypothetical protein